MLCFITLDVMFRYIGMLCFITHIIKIIKKIIEKN